MRAEGILIKSVDVFPHFFYSTKHKYDLEFLIIKKYRQEIFTGTFIAQSADTI